jgi:hypothetical protein
MNPKCSYSKGQDSLIFNAYIYIYGIIDCFEFDHGFWIYQDYMLLMGYATTRGWKFPSNQWKFGIFLMLNGV